jgi:DNA-binding MarR family transcriptional regulator/predicted GNAT family acetyltransferase
MTGEFRFLANAFHLETGPAASEIAAELRLDPAYLTRILRKFANSDLTQSSVDPHDQRRRILSLTEKGRAALAELQAAASRDVAGLVEELSGEELQELQAALNKVQDLLGGRRRKDAEVTIRRHRVGDVGWVIHRQARLYDEEYGWNIEFEGLLAEIGADFIKNFTPGRDFCWIAEMDGRPVGAVFLVRDNEETAKLRLLHVEASARGHGIGMRLVSECVSQARKSGYKRLVLWTNDVLVAARRIYEKHGFRLVAEEKHHSFGKDLVGQNWELAL